VCLGLFYLLARATVFTLTSKGIDISKGIWEQIPDPVKKTVIQVKEEIALLDPAALKEKAHREFPEYRKTYTELDAEP